MPDCENRGSSLYLGNGPKGVEWETRGWMEAGDLKGPQAWLVSEYPSVPECSLPLKDWVPSPGQPRSGFQDLPPDGATTLQTGCRLQRTPSPWVEEPGRGGSTQAEAPSKVGVVLGVREKVLPQLYLWFRGGLRQRLAGCGDQKVPCQGQLLVHTEKITLHLPRAPTSGAPCLLSPKGLGLPSRCLPQCETLQAGLGWPHVAPFVSG